MKKEASFTLIELLVVITAIGLIATITLVSVGSAREKARIGKALEFNQQIEHILGAYALGLWRFEEAGNIVMDSSGYANDGIVFGTTRVEGIIGFGRRFDGIDDYIAIQNLYFDRAGAISELTVCAWFKTTFSGGGFSENWAFLDFDRDSYFSFYIRGGDGKLGFSTRETGGGIDDFQGNRVLNDGKWHFGCAVYDGRDKILYVDGFEDNKELNAHGGANLGRNVTRYGFIGDGSEASTFNGVRKNRYYEGEMDEVFFYEQALTSAQIRSYYLVRLNDF